MQLTKDQVVEALRAVKRPTSRDNIVDENTISGLEIDEHRVSLQLHLTELNSTIEKSLRYQIQKALAALDSEIELSVGFLEEHKEIGKQTGAVFVVGSGKGGVGKSSLSVNLAVALKDLGYKVGLLDCDIYGPSIPTMLGVAERKPVMLNGKIQPIEALGLKIMSVGFFLEPGQSVVWRGPMIHKMIEQFLNDVDWGEWDALIVDLPPGTGDAPLSVVQILNVTGAIMVSLPQNVSLIDVHKGISMFRQLNVPVVGVIENMSYFECPSCQHIEEIFDRGGVKQLCQEVGVPYLGEIPIEPQIRKLSDEGKAFVQEHPASGAAEAIRSVAEVLEKALKERSLSRASNCEREKPQESSAASL